MHLTYQPIIWGLSFDSPGQWFSQGTLLLASSNNETDQHNIAKISLTVGPKLKNCLLPAPDRPLQNVATQNNFWCDLWRFYFFGYRKFWYCSRIYVRSWFTHLNEQNPLLDFEGIRFVNERSLFWRGKNPPTYRPIGEMEGQVRETNIYLRVA